MLKQGTGISASVAAILSSVATISCCLPLGFAAALGAGAASAFFTTLRPWLLGLSVALLGVGFWQQHRAKQCSTGPHDWEHTSVGGPYCGVGNDSVSAGDCRIHRRQVLRKMKRRLTGVAVAAVLALLAAAYLWGPGSAPRGQEPVVTLSEGNPAEFEKAFDADSNVPRLVLLLSPT